MPFHFLRATASISRDCWGAY